METINQSDMQDVLKKLAKLQEDVDYLKANMVDIDNIVTEDDKRDFEEYERDKREGKLISEEQLKKELGL